MSTREDDGERRPAAYIAGAVVNIVMLWFVNAIPGWGWQFITTDFPAVLWALNLSLGVQIAGNALLVFIHPRPVHYLVQVLFNAVSILALVIMVTVYPFDLSSVLAGPVDMIARIVLYVALGATILAAVVNAVKVLGSFFGGPFDRGANA